MLRASLKMSWSLSLKTVKFNIAAINRCTEAEGPFKRLAIWFQGCDRRCAGCCNPKMLEFKPVNILNGSELMKIIVEAKTQFDIEGVTFLGGEPTLQQGLAELAQAIRLADLGIVLFTGKQVDELPKKLMAAVDLIVDGGFEQYKKETTRNLIGSTNQRVIHMTERYRLQEKWFYTKRSKLVDINILDALFITGDMI